MRRFAALLALFLCATPLAADKKKKSSLDLPQGYSWESNWEVARQKQALDGKLLFVDFSTAWCGYCKKLDANTFPNEGVKKFLNTMLVIKINPDDGKEWKALAEKYEVSGYPHLLVLTPKGDIIARVGGYMGPEEFEGGVTQDAWNAYVAAEKSGNSSAMAETLFIVRTWFPTTRAGASAEEAFKKNESNAEFAAAYEAVLRRNDRESLVLKADAQLKAGRKKDSIESYKKVALEHPDTAEAETAKAALKKLGVKLEAPAK